MFCLYKILNIFKFHLNTLKYCKKKIKVLVKEFRILYVEGGEVTLPSQCVLLTVLQCYPAGPTISASALLSPPSRLH